MNTSTANQIDYNQYHFYTDGGHGWLKVPKELCKPFEDKISGYSYQDEQNYYLEEDCDMTLIFKELGLNYEENETVFRTQDRERFWRCIGNTDTSMSNRTIFVRNLRRAK